MLLPAKKDTKMKRKKIVTPVTAVLQLATALIATGIIPPFFYSHVWVAKEYPGASSDSELTDIEIFLLANKKCVTPEVNTT